MGASTALALGALLFLALHESGCRVQALLPACGSVSVAETTALGMAVWIALGGLLNSLDAARPLVLGVLFSSAVAAAVLRLLRAVRRQPPTLDAIGGCWPLLPLLGMGFAIIAFALPSAALNAFDDLANYLVLPYRMLGTGTLSGTALDSLGVDALGGQSFMQALVLLVAPAGFAPLFDSLFCLLLAGLLLDAVGRRLGCPAVTRCVVLLLFVVLDSQAINLSAVYSSVVLTLALLLSALRRLDPGCSQERAQAVAAGLRIGLLSAALVTLKMPHALFALLLSAGLVALLPLLGMPHPRALAGAVLRSGSVLLLPWLVVLWRTQGDALTRWLSTSDKPAVSAGGSLGELLADNGFYFTSPPLDYLWLLLFAVACLLAASCGLRTGRLVAVTGMALLAVILALLATTLLVDAHAAVRFLAPLVVALSAVCAQVALSALSRRLPGRAARVGRAAVLAAVALLGWRFSDDFAARLRAIADDGRLFSVAMSSADVRGVRVVLGIDGYALARGLQNLVPEGAVLLAPVAVAAHFDFARNRIITVHASAFAAPWSVLSTALDEAQLGRLLTRMGVDYLLLQSAGIGVRPRAALLAQRDTPGVSKVMRRLAARELAWRDALNAVAARGHDLYRDRSLRLVALRQ